MRRGIDPFKKLDQGVFNLPLSSFEGLGIFVSKDTETPKRKSESVISIREPERGKVKFTLLPNITAKQFHEAATHECEERDIHGQPRIPRNLLDYLPKRFGHSEPVAVEKNLPVFLLFVTHGANCNTGTMGKQFLDRLCRWCYVVPAIQKAQCCMEAI